MDYAQPIISIAKEFINIRIPKSILSQPMINRKSNLRRIRGSLKSISSGNCSSVAFQHKIIQLWQKAFLSAKS